MKEKRSRHISHKKHSNLDTTALTKKRRYLPKYIPGEEIKDHFVDQNVGDIPCSHKKLNEVQFHLHCMKEPDYIISLMSICATMERFGEEKNYSWKKDSITKTAKF